LKRVYTVIGNDVWIGTAARQGHRGAFVDIGVLFWEGLGVAREDTESYMEWALERRRRRRDRRLVVQRGGKDDDLR
jgi:hypothetical protein